MGALEGEFPLHFGLISIGFYANFSESTLPKTNIAPENEWLEDDFFLGYPVFRGYVRFRESRSVPISSCRFRRFHWQRISATACTYNRRAHFCVADFRTVVV